VRTLFFVLLVFLFPTEAVTAAQEWIIQMKDNRPRLLQPPITPDHCPRSCSQGLLTCPEPCLKLSEGSWTMKDGKLWRGFEYAQGETFRIASWAQDHVGERIEMVNGVPKNLGICITCGGTTQVPCSSCDHGRFQKQLREGPIVRVTRKAATLGGLATFAFLVLLYWSMHRQVT
jgi:hypothetical protein